MIRLSSFVNIEKLDIIKNESGYYAVLDSVNNLSFAVCTDEIVLRYCKEHQHFYAFDYKDEKEWIEAFAALLRKIVNRTVKFEYCYRGKVPTKTRIYSLNEQSNWELIENVNTSLNFFRSFYPIRIVTETIVFQQQ